MVIPETDEDASQWEGASPFRSTAEDQQVESSLQRAAQYHVETKLPTGGPSLLLDIGSVGNLAGDQWVQEQARAALDDQLHELFGIMPETTTPEPPSGVRQTGLDVAAHREPAYV